VSVDCYAIRLVERMLLFSTLVAYALSSEKVNLVGALRRSKFVIFSSYQKRREKQKNVS